MYVPDEGTEFATLTEKADKALYQVKHFGKHGCAFYGAETFDGASPNSIAQTQMLLSERDSEAGAYVVSFEKFKALYRYASRLNENGYEIKLLQFTFDTEDENERELFWEQLRERLNRSDCLTQYGRDQFLILTSTAEEVLRKVTPWVDKLTIESS